MIELSLLVIALLVLAAFIAGYIDTLVGGGGLIVIPALLAAGVPPILALGTNKLQAVGGSGTATYSLWRRAQFTFAEVRTAMLAAFFGAVVGTLVVQQINAQTLSFVIPMVIGVIAAYFLLAPMLKLVSKQRISQRAYSFTAVPAIGFYDGMFGPATGSFLVMAGSALRGQAIVTATKYAKPLNFATNAASLSVFIWAGQVLWALGIMMFLGQLLGARLGTKRLMTINPEALRYLVISLCLVMLISLFW